MAYEFNHYYELQNVATGKYVNVLGNHEDGTVKNGEGKSCAAAFYDCCASFCLYRDGKTEV